MCICGLNKTTSMWWVGIQNTKKHFSPFEKSLGGEHIIVACCFELIKIFQQRTWHVAAKKSLVTQPQHVWQIHVGAQVITKQTFTACRVLPAVLALRMNHGTTNISSEWFSLKKSLARVLSLLVVDFLLLSGFVRLVTVTSYLIFRTWEIFAPEGVNIFARFNISWSICDIKAIMMGEAAGILSVMPSLLHPGYHLGHDV